MSVTADKNTVTERPIWGLPSIGRYLGVSEVTLHRWIRMEAPVARALRSMPVSTGGNGRRWYAYPSDLDAVMRG